MRRKVIKRIKPIVTCIICIVLFALVLFALFIISIFYPTFFTGYITKKVFPHYHYHSYMEATYMCSGSIYQGTIPEFLKDIEKSLNVQGVMVSFVTNDVPPIEYTGLSGPPDGSSICLCFSALVMFADLEYSVSSDGTFIFYKRKNKGRLGAFQH